MPLCKSTEPDPGPLGGRCLIPMWPPVGAAAQETGAKAPSWKLRLSWRQQAPLGVGVPEITQGSVEQCLAGYGGGTICDDTWGVS